MHENGNKTQINIFCEPYYKAVIFYEVSYLQISSKWYISTVMSSIMISWLPVTSFTRVHIAMKLKMLHWESFVSHPTNPISVHFHFSMSSLLFPANTHTQTFFHSTFVLLASACCNSCMDSLCASPRRSSCLFRKLICCWVLSLLLSWRTNETNNDDGGQISNYATNTLFERIWEKQSLMIWLW